MKKADVSLKTKEARVEFDDSRISLEQVTAAIDRLGFQASVISVDPASR